ncbi:hypothetical protein Tco_0151487 [Tanacetum coccineum]
MNSCLFDYNVDSKSETFCDLMFKDLNYGSDTEAHGLSAESRMEIADEKKDLLRRVSSVLEEIGEIDRDVGCAKGKISAVYGYW